jgi:ketosteroid isomerase-like protein
VRHRWRAGPAGLTEQDKTTIRSVDEPVRQAMISGKPDLSTLVAMIYAPDVELLPPGEPTVKGLDAARVHYSDWSTVEDFTSAEVHLDGNGRFAYRQTTFTVTLDVPSAPGPVVGRGKGIVVVRKEADGKWKAVAEIWNADEPEATPSVAAPGRSWARASTRQRSRR